MTEPVYGASALTNAQSEPRRSARLRKLKDDKGKVTSKYFVQSAPRNLVSKRASERRKRKSDQTR